MVRGAGGKGRVRALWAMAAAGALVLVLCAPHVALCLHVASFGPGFLHIRPQSPAQSLRLTIPPLLPGSIPPGWSVVTAATLSNVWINDPSVNLDYETLDQHLTMAYGLNEHFGLAVMYDQRNYFGGILDGLIQGFHNTFDMGQDGRDLVPKNSTNMTILDDQGSLVIQLDDLSVFNNRAVTILVQWVPVYGRGGGAAVGLTGAVRLNLETPGAGEDNGMDWSVGLGLARYLGSDLYGCLHLDYQAFAQDSVLGFRFTDDARTVMLGLAWQASPDVALLAQYFINDGVIENLSQFSSPSHELDAGVKVAVSPNGVLEAAILENIFTFDNGPDLGFHLGYKHQF